MNVICMNEYEVHVNTLFNMKPILGHLPTIGKCQAVPPKLNCFLKKSPPIEVQEPRPHKQENKITSDECGKNAEIPPSVIEAETQWLIVLVAGFVRTVLANFGRVAD